MHTLNAAPCMPTHRVRALRSTPFATTLTTSLVTTLLASALASPALAQTPPVSACAQVEVHHVRAQQGQLMVAAYGDADSFGKKPLTQKMLPAGDTVMRFELCGLHGHSVALTLFQDLDTDGKLARNLVGIPTEPWGGSGTPGAFGPTWETGRVALDGKVIVVKLTP